MKADCPTGDTIVPESVPTTRDGQASSPKSHVRRDKSAPPITEILGSRTKLNKETNNDGLDFQSAKGERASVTNPEELRRELLRLTQQDLMDITMSGNDFGCKKGGSAPVTFLEELRRERLKSTKMDHMDINASKKCSHAVNTGADNTVTGSQVEIHAGNKVPARVKIGPLNQNGPNTGPCLLPTHPSLAPLRCT